MEIKDILSMIGTAVGVVGGLSGLYTTYSTRKEKALQKQKELEKERYPIRLDIKLDARYHEKIIHHDVPTRVDLDIRIQIRNVSGKPVSINEPYAFEAENGSKVLLDSGPVTFPYLLPDAATFTCARPFDEVFADFPGDEELLLEPRCELADGTEFIGQARRFRRGRLLDAESAEQATRRRNRREGRSAPRKRPGGRAA
jgi:hypothetical protein